MPRRTMLVAYDVALDLVRALRPVVAQLRTSSSEAADQVERAASRIVLDLAEGDRRHGRDRARPGLHPRREFTDRNMAVPLLASCTARVDPYCEVAKKV